MVSTWRDAVSRSVGMRACLLAIAVWLMLAMVGCASVPEGDRDPRDPWESYNRAVTRFNDDFDRDIYRPVARGYKAVAPHFVDVGVTNFFGNQLDVMSAINNLFQLKLRRAASDVGRVAVNSTIGLLGFIDVASDLDMQKYREDFGQTLGYWNVGPGPYFVWPILGPKTVRDSFGLVADWYSTPVAYMDPFELRLGMAVLYGVDTRADLLGASDVLEQAALDPYAFTRDAYLQKRINDIYDGQPPPEQDVPSLEDEMFRDLEPSNEFEPPSP